MNILDIILLLCFIPAVISGLRKGFIAQVVAIISLVLGIWLSVRFASAAGAWLGQWIEASQQLLNVISFAVIFIVVTHGKDDKDHHVRMAQQTPRSSVLHAQMHAHPRIPDNSVQHHQRPVRPRVKGRPRQIAPVRSDRENCKFRVPLS